MLAPIHDSLWLVPFSIFLGGLLGSPHCLSMCGPIVLNFAKERSHLIAYQFGRMVAYSTAGAIVGAFGQAVLGTERPLWVSGLSLGLIAVLLFINGYRAFFGKPIHFSGRLFSGNFSKNSLGKLSSALSSLAARFWRALRPMALPKVVTAGLAGTLTVLLPCGHLYSFLLGAVATGSAAKGAAFMFAFWLGSTPVLSIGGSWLQKILRPQINTGPRWTGALLVLAGIFSALAFAFRAEDFTKHSHDHSTHEHKTHQHSEHNH